MFRHVPSNDYTVSDNQTSAIPEIKVKQEMCFNFVTFQHLRSLHGHFLVDICLRSCLGLCEMYLPKRKYEFIFFINIF